MKSLMLAAVSLVLCSGADRDKSAAVQRGLQDFQGTWSVVSMEMDGKFLPRDKIEKTRLTIDGEKFTFKTAVDSHQGRYKIDPTTDPKQLSIEVQSGDEQGKVYLVIYKFEDGKMIQCMRLDNQRRPSEFTGKTGSGNLYEVWQRAKP